MPTTVNPQITDAVTQSNVTVVAEAPALAMGSVYQSLSHATGILFANAVSQQQQQNILAQAAANQGLTQLYSLNTVGAAGAMPRMADDADVTSPLAAAREAVSQINSQITDAVNFSLDKTLLHSGDVGYGVRAAADALAASIERVNRANRENLLRVVQLSARSACLAAMLRDPDKTDAYRQILGAIDDLV